MHPENWAPVAEKVLSAWVGQKVSFQPAELHELADRLRYSRAAHIVAIRESLRALAGSPTV